MAERERAARMARAEQVRARLAPIIAERQAASRPWKTALMRDLGLWAIRDLKAVLGDPGTELPDAYVLDRVEQYLGEHGA